MFSLTTLEPVDYLIIGHLTCDITHTGLRLGGTATYAALTAQAMGLRVGIVTSWGAEIPLGPLRNIPVASFPTDKSTTFENIYTSRGRVQTLHHVAPRLEYYMVPEPWRNAPIVHLGPVAQEVDPSLVRHFPSSLVGVTPQGFMRSWDETKRVYAAEWPEAPFVLQQAGAAVFSIEDVDGSEARVEEMVAASRVLVVTEGPRGSRVYWNGDVRRFLPPEKTEVDATGAGDIFAAAFFYRLYSTRDPWEAARFATLLAANSVTRPGVEGIPRLSEVEASMVEII
jgi:sugar/nucleoside kinase (ribokinase family)